MPDTRERIVNTALELFYDQGFEATSLKQVGDGAGVHGGSLYHFFPTKAALVEAVLERYLALLDPVLMEPARRAAPDPVGRVLALLAGYREHIVGTEFTRGCPIGALALELAESHPGARERVQANFRAWRAAVAEILAEAIPAAVADEAGALVLGVMEGAVMQARTERSVEPYDACTKHLRRYLEALVEEAAA